VTAGVAVVSWGSAGLNVHSLAREADEERAGGVVEPDGVALRDLDPRREGVHAGGQRLRYGRRATRHVLAVAKPAGTSSFPIRPRGLPVGVYRITVELEDRRGPDVVRRTFVARIARR
jgi:hypothetical protein